MNRQNRIMLAIFILLLIGGGICYQSFLSRKEPEAMPDENLEIILPGKEISALYDDGERLWVGTTEGIYFVNSDTGEMICKLEADIEMIYAAEIAQTDDGTIWAGHDKGLSAFDREGHEILRIVAPDIPEGRVNAILTVDNGLWIGCQSGAAYLAKKDGIWQVEETLSVDSGLAEEVVQVIKKVGDELWFGSYLGTGKGGISIRSSKGWEYLTPEDGIPHRYINAILPLSDSKVLVGSGQLIYGGLSLAEKRNGKWEITKNWNQEDGIPGMKVRFLYLDSMDRLWITTEADGILILDRVEDLEKEPLSGYVAKQENGLADNEVKCIVESDSCFWLGGKYGLTRFGKDER